MSGLAIAVNVGLAIPAHATPNDPKTPGGSPGAESDRLISITAIESNKATVEVAARGPSGSSSATTQETCGWNIDQTVVSTYSPIGNLISVATQFGSRVTCTGDVADYIFNRSYQIYNGREVENGFPDDCAEPPCRGSYSFGVYQCTSFFLCAGDYAAEGRFSIVLDPEYYWPEPAPPGCQILTGGLTLQCSLRTDPIDVPPFG